MPKRGDGSSARNAQISLLNISAPPIWQDAERIKKNSVGSLQGFPKKLSNLRSYGGWSGPQAVSEFRKVRQAILKIIAGG